MSSRLPFLLFAAFCWSFLVIGCGDDETTTDPTPDAGTDTAAETVEDTAVEDTPEPDDVPVSDPVEEITQPDMPTGGCSSHEECEGDQLCIGSGCADPVTDLDGYVAEAADGPNSFIWKMQLPTLLPERVACCFDYSGNGRPNNAIGDLLPVLQLLAGLQPGELQGYLDEYIENGTVNVLTDWRELPMDGAELGDGDAKMNFFIGHSETDNWDTIVAGDGQFSVDPMSLGSHGALIQFNLAAINEGLLLAGPSTFVLTIPPIPGFFEDGLVLNLERAQIMADIKLEDNGMHTIDSLAGDPGDEYLVGGGRLGGVVNADQLVGYLDDYINGCACAGVDPSNPVLNYGEQDGRYVISCNPDSYEVNICCDPAGGPTGCIEETPPNCCPDGDFCTYIPMVCEYGGIIAEILDVDLNGSGVPNGLSVGVLFSWTGAEIIGISDVE